MTMKNTNGIVMPKHPDFCRHAVRYSPTLKTFCSASRIPKNECDVPAESAGQSRAAREFASVEKAEERKGDDREHRRQVSDSKPAKNREGLRPHAEPPELRGFTMEEPARRS